MGLDDGGGARRDGLGGGWCRAWAGGVRVEQGDAGAAVEGGGRERLGMRWWVYLLATFLIAFAFACPLFLMMRERRLRAIAAG